MQLWHLLKWGPRMDAVIREGKTKMAPLDIRIPESGKIIFMKVRGSNGLVISLHRTPEMRVQWNTAYAMWEYKYDGKLFFIEKNNVAIIDTINDDQWR